MCYSEKYFVNQGPDNHNFDREYHGKCSKILNTFPSLFSNKMLVIMVRTLKMIVRITNEQLHEISNNVVCATSKGSDQPAHMRRLIRAFASCLNIL